MALEHGLLSAGTDPALVSASECVVVVVGTPVDEYLSPDPQAVPRALEELASHLGDGQLVVLRSTVFPGVTRLVERLLQRTGHDVDVAFCPERIAEGQGDDELFALPQIVAGAHCPGRKRAEELFRRLTDSIVDAHPGGGRAGEAVHQHLAVHQVRRGQPVLHDRQRPRPRLRPDPAGDDRTTTRARPTCRGPGSRPGRVCSRTRCSWRRSTTTLRARVTPRCWSTRACPHYLVERIEAGRRPVTTDRRHPRDGVQGRERRPPLEPVLQAQAAAVASGPSACSRPTPTSVTTRRCSRSRMCWPDPTCSWSAPRTRVYRDLDTTLPVVDIWNLRGAGSRM